jgi:hypothetical protein
MGPYPIACQISTSAYKLTLPASLRGVHPVFHVSVLQKNNPDSIAQRQHPKPTPIEINREEEWEVAEILDCRKRGKKQEYLISWEGWGPEENTWEQETNLENCKQKVKEFNKRYPEAANRHKQQKRRK